MIDSKVTPWILSNLERLQKLCYRKRKELGWSKSLQSIWAAKDFFTEILEISTSLIKVFGCNCGHKSVGLFSQEKLWNSVGLSWNSVNKNCFGSSILRSLISWISGRCRKKWLKVTDPATWRILREWLMGHVFWTGTFGSASSSDSCLGCTVILREQSLRLLLS